MNPTLHIHICRRCKAGPYRFDKSLKRVGAGRCDNCGSKLSPKAPGHLVQAQL